ncbi:hypothetical protein IH779_00360 [Patescibacteria group bacterium]|nr:hypothetical protein [Patescibacteria group bacterium]
MDTQREVKRILDQLTLDHARELDEEEAKRRKERKKREKKKQEKMLEQLERHFEGELERIEGETAEGASEKRQGKRQWYGKNRYR